MALTETNRLLRRAARFAHFADLHPRCAEAALAGRCEVTPLEEIEIPVRVLPVRDHELERLGAWIEAVLTNDIGRD